MSTKEETVLLIIIEVAESSEMTIEEGMIHEMKGRLTDRLPILAGRETDQFLLFHYLGPEELHIDPYLLNRDEKIDPFHHLLVV